MYLDLFEDLNECFILICLGYCIGCKVLIELFDIYKSIGVNYLFFVLFDG